MRKRLPRKKNNLTKKQRNEIETLDYLGLNCNYDRIEQLGSFTDVQLLMGDDDPEACYFQITDLGLKKVKTNNVGRLKYLLDAQRWRGRHVEMYEGGVLEGSTPYSELFENAPYAVIEYMAGAMFKGMDKDLILNGYKNGWDLSKLKI